MTSVYVHVPFCERKCPYCAFESGVPAGGERELYLDTLAAELGDAPRGEASTLYVGGGTPTVLSAREHARLFAMLARAYPLARGAEVTVEANPNSLSDEHLALWRDVGVTRVSLGVQSLDDGELRTLGRLHDAKTAMRAAESVLASGLGLSVDLMFALPGQSVRRWGEQLKAVISLAPHHISVYQLTVEEGTPFAERALDLCDGADHYRLAQWMLPRAGYAQYEVANFARAGHESRHNLNYWRDGAYVGVGPGAWGYDGRTRRKNAWPLAEWARAVRDGGGPSFEESLDDEAASRQAAVLALRTSTGMIWEDFAARYGDAAAGELRRALGAYPRELVESDGRSTRLTKRGMRVANAIWSELI